MTPEQKAAVINARAAMLVATAIGMHAENMQRQALGYSMAYGEDAFQKVIDESGCQHNAVMTLLEG